MPLASGVGNRAANNLIHDAPRQAIDINGNDYIFKLNVVHHICTETNDCGERSGIQPGRGSVP